MKDALDRAEESLNRLARRQRYDERNRLALLAVHGYIGIFTGAMIWIGGGPTTWALLVGSDDKDWILGAPAVIGGLTLLVGLYAGRSLMIEAVGMVVMLAWDLTMVYLFVFLSPNKYPTSLYLGLALLMSIHLGTLIAYAREERA